VASAELQNIKLPSQAAILTGGVIYEPDAPAGQYPESDWIPAAKASVLTLDDAMTKHIRYALQLCNGKISGPGGAGELLGINPNTLRKRMDKLKITYGRAKASGGSITDT
jgi:transcriptional regulator of acetoin/glycerol metabolism